MTKTMSSEFQIFESATVRKESLLYLFINRETYYMDSKPFWQLFGFRLSQRVSGIRDKYCWH